MDHDERVEVFVGVQQGRNVRKGRQRREQSAAGVWRRVQHDKRVGPALARGGLHKPAGVLERQGQRGRVQVHLRGRAEVQQTLEVALQSDLRVVRGRASQDVGGECQRERLQNRPRRRRQRVGCRAADQCRDPRMDDVVLERLGDGQAGDPVADSDLPRQVGQNRVPSELRVGGELDRARRRCERMRGREDGRPSRSREDAQAAGRFECLAGVRIGRIVKPDQLQQRDVNGMRVGMEELGADIDDDALA